MSRRFVVYIVLVSALLSSCGNNDRAEVVEIVLDNYRGVDIVESCVEDKVDQFTDRDIEIVAENARTGGSGISFLEQLSPHARVINESLLFDCIDLELHRETQIGVLATRQPDIDIECFRAQWPLEATYQEMDSNFAVALRFCRRN